MAPYKTFLRTMVLFVSIELLIGLLILYVSPWFMAPFFGLIYLSPLAFRGIDCPKCGVPLTYQGTFLGIRINGGFPHKFCRECGCDLSKAL